MINKASNFGDVEKFQVTINGNDISESVQQVGIFQDIFSPVWSCEIYVLDTVNALSKHGYKSGDKVKVSISTKQGFDTDGSKDVEFVLHEITDKVQESHKLVRYTMICAQDSVIKNLNKKVSRVYRDMEPHKIVEDVVKEELSKQVGDKPPKPEQLKPHNSYKIKDGSRKKSKTDNQITYIANNISPFDVVADMLKCAVMNSKADFVFFTKDKDKFAFESINNMWKRKPCVKFVQRPNAIKTNGDYNINKNLEFPTFVAKHFNVVNNITTGYDANTLITFDIMEKKFDKKEGKREGGKNKKGESDSVVIFHPIYKNVFEKEQSDKKNMFDYVDDWFSSRRTNLLNLEQNLFTIQTTGHVKAFEWLSEICEIDIPKNDSMDGGELDDKYAGKYMIVAVGHIITKKSYFVNIEIANGWDK